MTKDKYLLSSVYNTLEILDLLSEYKELGVTEISKKLNLGKSSVFRMLYTLEKKKYVYKTSDAKYRLGIKFVYYGQKLLEEMNSLDVIRPYLKELRDEHNETVHLSILDKSDYNIIILDKIENKSTIQMSSRIGKKLPGYCTAMGKALLASLPDEELEEIVFSLELEKKTENTITDPNKLLETLKKIREQGYSEDSEESEEGLVCYAVPIRNIHGDIVAAISFSGPSSRMEKKKEELINSLKITAEEVSKSLGYVGN